MSCLPFFVTFLFEIIAFRHLIEMAIRRSCNLSEAYAGHIGRQYSIISFTESLTPREVANIHNNALNR